MFTVDHSKGEAFEPIKPGEYEATVINFEEKTAASSGNKRLVVDYEIRSDVEQPCQGQKSYTITSRLQTMLCGDFTKHQRPQVFQTE